MRRSPLPPGLWLILTGKTDAAVAAALSIHRSTIVRCRRHTLAFTAELHRRRQAIYEAAADRLRTPRHQVPHDPRKGNNAFRVHLGLLERLCLRGQFWVFHKARINPEVLGLHEVPKLP